MPVLHTLDELSGWLRFSQEPRLGAAAYGLLRAIGSPEAIYAAPRAVLADAAGHALARQLTGPPEPAMAAAIRAAQCWVQAADHHIVTLGSDFYPPLLLELGDPPLLLYVDGDPALLARPSLALVGSRNASAAGQENAAAFARALAIRGWGIVSGLARGIDAAAHGAALDAGERGAGTVAILGTGIDRIYPAAHRALTARIAAHGALVSEFPFGAPPLRHHFPRRNRLVAGLTRGILVVEATHQSGSLITARLGADLGRDVFAIPGSIHSPLSRGCHALIRQGAKLVETASDITEELHVHAPPATPDRPRMTPGRPKAAADRPSATLDHSRTGPKSGSGSGSESGSAPLPASTHSAVLDALGYEPAAFDTLYSRTGIATPALQAELLELELAGWLRRLPGGCFERIARGGPPGVS